MDSFSQIEFYNHSNCDRFTIRIWDSILIQSLKISKVKSDFVISKFFDFSDSVSDLTIIKNVKSNIQINNLITFHDCFVNNCSCDFNDRLDTIFKAFITNPGKIKLLGYFKPYPDLYCLVLLIQFPKNTQDYIEYKSLDSYILNFDSNFKLISTAHIGNFEISNPGLGYSKSDSKISIRNNVIIAVNSEYILTDMVGVPSYKANKISKVIIKENGQIKEFK